MSSDSPAAQQHPLPTVHYYSVEYPGYVRNESTSIAVRNLGGERMLSDAFKRATTKQECIVEAKLRPDDVFSHPIHGDMVPTNNIVLKVTKRKRRRRAEGEGSTTHIGEYKVEAAGLVEKTVRFRSIADFQYRVPKDDPITKLRTAMVNLDVEGIRSFKIPPEREEYLVPANSSIANLAIDPQLQPESTTGRKDVTMKSNMRMFPPPLFSRQNLPLNYNYKANPASLLTTVINDETGEERVRLINRMRWKGLASASITYDEPTIPEKPPKNVEDSRAGVNIQLLEKLARCFDDRPIWSKMAILNQFTVNEAREIHNSKNMLPLVAYVFSDGPWRDTHIRFGYDPRQKPETRIYQRLYFRDKNHQIVRASINETRQERAQAAALKASRPVERSRAHLFDGVTLAKDTRSFQLCDIVDPMLKDMIDDDEDLRETCHERDGWYSTDAFNAIKTVLRHKFYSLVEGYVATDEECEALLIPSEDTGRTPVPHHARKHRHHKHNMAKGALSAEAAAAVRLRAQIERKTKEGQDD